MSVLVWFIGLVLIVLSMVLLFAGLTGRQGTLRIGKRAMQEPEREPPSERQLVYTIVVGIIGVLAGIEVIRAFGR